MPSVVSEIYPESSHTLETLIDCDLMAKSFIIRLNLILLANSAHILKNLKFCIISPKISCSSEEHFSNQISPSFVI